MEFENQLKDMNNIDTTIHKTENEVIGTIKTTPRMLDAINYANTIIRGEVRTVIAQIIINRGLDADGISRKQFVDECMTAYKNGDAHVHAQGKPWTPITLSRELHCLYRDITNHSQSARRNLIKLYELDTTKWENGIFKITKKWVPETNRKYKRRKIKNGFE